MVGVTVVAVRSVSCRRPGGHVHLRALIVGYSRGMADEIEQATAAPGEKRPRTSDGRYITGRIVVWASSGKTWHVEQTKSAAQRALLRDFHSFDAHIEWDDE